MKFKCFATCPKGLEELLAAELEALGVEGPRQTRAGVHFEGDLTTAYRVCLWSRLANRVFMPLADFTAKTTDELYEQVRLHVNWYDHMDVGGSLAVDFSAAGSNRFHSHYAALRIKDAIVDQFNDRFGRRPSVDTERPDIRINVYMKHDSATLSLDLSGDSLHRRGYRTEAGAAPMKENLAAAVLIRAGWQELAKGGAALVDPMCGSGTLLIEAAMMALDIAPGLNRKYFGFINWKQHDQASWRLLLQEARKRARAGATGAHPVFVGSDSDPDAIRLARANSQRAGLSEYISLEKKDLSLLNAPVGVQQGLVVANPPYGERLGEKQSLVSLYRLLGERLKDGFVDWQAAILTANPDLCKNMGIRSKKHYQFYNGALACRLLNFEVNESWYMHEKPSRISGPMATIALDTGSEMFANRIRKNMKNIGRWAAREGISCFRLYDADMPEYAVAIDLYNDWVHVQEYQAPETIDPADAKRRLNQVITALRQVLDAPADHIILKIRKRTRGKDQYQRLNDSERFFEVQENGLKFLVNLTDYQDAGLFLDHRIARQMIRKYAEKRRMLNLFCYTATATVYAAAGGATHTTSVDMSYGYLEWARKNLALNGYDTKNHLLIRDDCLKWVCNHKDRYDLIFLDPPTFSNSRRMEESFDIQRDHVKLISQVIRLLAPDGLLIFSCNRHKFRLETDALSGLQIKDVTLDTIPKDFERNKRIHHCFEIRN
ncbi:Ribosomal RNA large subunit methyltransferase K/L (Includes: 23S rRNA m2G2445 methyltransferase; 23S rRNA m7G2069 methyltransferase) [uncultured Desulfobacterium sp.]|uniref:Ribosomal RNA large subunit methyltransferase K/L n=1 Tax=uncultured Desulfobacterium sp. TaxID=201089 RepID=A0A445N0Y3_9BACT|nr:Ribosomal RNA large subunit methyltransferase K/L (Includes: 23S rRNA m2G2445 methyltransferase; 23S rRNA m7G2069 methyltransferase) [uncultured Desulfobacterium sp.]